MPSIRYCLLFTRLSKNALAFGNSLKAEREAWDRHGGLDAFRTVTEIKKGDAVKAHDKLLSLCGVLLAAVDHQGLAQTTSTIYNVNTYHASGSSNYAYCSGQAGAQVLTGCTFNGNNNDFKVGQGINLYGGGAAPRVQTISGHPHVNVIGSVTGTHSYCYVVVSADPFLGMSAPSQASCTPATAKLPDPLSYENTYIALDIDPYRSDGTTPNANVGPSPSFVWYVSKDQGPYYVLTVASIGSGGPAYATAYAMDTGQRADGAGDPRGGWPDDLPFDTSQWPKVANSGTSSPPMQNEEFFSTITGTSGNTITIADQLPQTIGGGVVLHDDTQAVQSAINAASQAGGGTVQLNAGYYRVLRPSFPSKSTYPTFSTDITTELYSAQFSSLQLPNGSSGNVTIQGQGNSSFIAAAPDSGGRSHFLDIGAFGRPASMGAPAYPGAVIKIQPVAKASTSLTLVSSTPNPSLAAGDDIWLYSGSFGIDVACTDVNGTPGGECHFSELNTIASVQGTAVTLVHPTSMRFYADQYGNSFGLVKLPKTPHNVSLRSFQMDDYNAILATGQVYGLLVDSLTLLKPASHGQFGGGTKRDVTIQNSTWHLGNGDATYAGTDEFDQEINVSLVGNNIYGYGAAGAEGPSLLPRIYGTEGSSQFKINNNHFYGAGVLLDQTTDDVVIGNQFQNGLLAIGGMYAPNGNCTQLQNDTGFVSFGSQANVDVENNVFTTTAGVFLAPSLLRTGSFDAAIISGNQLTFSSARPRVAPINVLVAASGNITQNTITLSNATDNSIGFCLTPNNSPTESITVKSNTIQGTGATTATVGAGIYIPNPGFSDPAPITLQGNTFTTAGGPHCKVDAPGSTPATCQ